MCVRANPSPETEKEKKIFSFFPSPHGNGRDSSDNAMFVFFLLIFGFRPVGEGGGGRELDWWWWG
jgi:hypothetical protein